MKQLVNYQPPRGMRLGDYDASQQVARTASRVRDAQYLANPDQGFATVYLATVNGVERKFARTSVGTLGLASGGPFKEILEAVQQVGELCPLEAAYQIVEQVSEAGDVFCFATPPGFLEPYLLYRGQMNFVYVDGNPHLEPGLVPDVDIVFMLKQAA